MDQASSGTSTAAPTNRRRSRQHWIVLAAALASGIFLVVAAVLLEPDPSGVGTHEQLGMQPCMTMKLFDFPCPGCGVTTSVTLAAHGRLAQSFSNQPFGFLVALALLAAGPWALVAHFRGRDLYADLTGLRRGRWLAILAVIVALSWVYKVLLVRG